jgi:hypothetical protein
MTETHIDNAETLAGAGTDVRRCSDALGPRKNLHRRVPQAWACTSDMGVYLKHRHPLGPELGTPLGT